MMANFRCSSVNLSSFTGDVLTEPEAIHYETRNLALVRPVDFDIQARLSCLVQSTSYS